ncbi:hypothetical protein TEA_024089 [Camellia sinensis var. sinensis]|uniref:Armadillo repeat-containing domain-containing protein n=1 Tax=Camellia sinensis var. sinensis TaxID=542762 RepID=A0A4S4EV87_CAMSN|nr:hypothetical protein TEA_024089 [Camellia sinensis var. sinensis]
MIGSTTSRMFGQLSGGTYFQRKHSEMVKSDPAPQFDLLNSRFDIDLVKPLELKKVTFSSNFKFDTSLSSVVFFGSPAEQKTATAAEMGPPKSGRSISQQAFDEMVKENIDDLGMDPSDALQDAIETLTLQGVDLSGIVTCVPGEGSVKDNPVIQSLDRLKQLNSDSTDRIGDQNDVDEVIVLLDKLADLCSIEGSGNAAIAMKNGGLELVCSVCLKLRGGSDRGLVSAFEAIASLLHGHVDSVDRNIAVAVILRSFVSELCNLMLAVLNSLVLTQSKRHYIGNTINVQSSETFQKNGGPKMVMGILNDGTQNLKILNGGFSVVAAAATGNEIVKESFMDLKIDELMIQILRTHGKGCIHSIYDAIQALLTPDDNRVVASQVYGYARRFAKIGIAEALVDLLKEGLSSPCLVSATMTLKAVAVNDEICRSIAASGGVDAVLRCIGDSGEQGNKIVARAACSLLSKLAGSDTNKSAIIEKGGMDRIIKLSARFFDDPSVLQEVMSVICVLSLRSPDNATRAIEAGAGDLAIQAMQRHPGAHQMQKSACMMIRNLVARNPENRQDCLCMIRPHSLLTLLLNNGIEKIIRKAKENHTSCKDAATDALRDLGLDNYNL